MQPCQRTKLTRCYRGITVNAHISPGAKRIMRLIKLPHMIQSYLKNITSYTYLFKNLDY